MLEPASERAASAAARRSSASRPRAPRAAWSGVLIVVLLWNVSAPVIAPTRVLHRHVARACSRATRSPSRSTSMRSATSRTSGMLWLIRTTDSPWSRTRRISSSTLRVCTTPSAAVGSSMNTTLLAHITARQIATPWRWPPDRLATGAVGVLDVDAEVAERLVGCGGASRPCRGSRACRAGRGAAARGRGTCSRPGRARAPARGPGRRSRCRARAPRAACGATTGLPSNRISPLSGGWTPESVLTSVLLPAPLSPISATTSRG